MAITEQTEQFAEQVATDVASNKIELNKALKRDDIQRSHDLYMQIKGGSRVASGSTVQPVLLRSPVDF